MSLTNEVLDRVLLTMKIMRKNRNNEGKTVDP